MWRKREGIYTVCLQKCLLSGYFHSCLMCMYLLHSLRCAYTRIRPLKGTSRVLCSPKIAVTGWKIPQGRDRWHKLTLVGRQGEAWKWQVTFEWHVSTRELINQPTFNYSTRETEDYHVIPLIFKFMSLLVRCCLHPDIREHISADVGGYLGLITNISKPIT
jgi:hypothetical protein